MPTSIRQQIINAVATRFATILTGSSYETDIGARVTLWNPKPIDERSLNGVDIMDVEETTTDEVTRHQDHTLTIHAVVHAKEGAATAAYLRKAIADIWASIGTDRFWTVSAIRLARGGTRPLKSEIKIDQAGEISGAARIQFQILYRTASFNPFVQTI